MLSHTRGTESCIEQDHRNFFAYVTCGNCFKIKPTLGSSDQADHHSHHYYKPYSGCACAGAGRPHGQPAAVAALHWGAALPACSLCEGHPPGIPPGPTGAACSPSKACCHSRCAEDENASALGQSAFGSDIMYRHKCQLTRLGSLSGIQWPSLQAVEVSCQNSPRPVLVLAIAIALSHSTRDHSPSCTHEWTATRLQA